MDQVKIIKLIIIDELTSMAIDLGLIMTFEELKENNPFDGKWQECFNFYYRRKHSRVYPHVH